MHQVGYWVPAAKLTYHERLQHAFALTRLCSAPLHTTDNNPQIGLARLL